MKLFDLLNEKPTGWRSLKAIWVGLLLWIWFGSRLVAFLVRPLLLPHLAAMTARRWAAQELIKIIGG